MTAMERPTLGGFMSLTCFQYLRVGTEEVADRAPILTRWPSCTNLVAMATPTMPVPKTPMFMSSP